MTPTFTAKLSLYIQPIGIGVQKIDSTTQMIYEMVIAGFSI